MEQLQIQCLCKRTVSSGQLCHISRNEGSIHFLPECTLRLFLSSTFHRRGVRHRVVHERFVFVRLQRTLKVLITIKHVTYFQRHVV